MAGSQPRACALSSHKPRPCRKKKKQSRSKHPQNHFGDCMKHIHTKRFFDPGSGLCQRQSATNLHSGTEFYLQAQYIRHRGRRHRRIADDSPSRARHACDAAVAQALRQLQQFLQPKPWENTRGQPDFLCAYSHHPSKEGRQRLRWQATSILRHSKGRRTIAETKNQHLCLPSKVKSIIT